MSGGWNVVETLLWRWREEDELEIPPNVVAAALASELQHRPLALPDELEEAA